MIFLIILGALLIGIYIGIYATKRPSRKTKRKEYILKHFENMDTITNNDVESILNVSDATATRYLQELEQDRKIRQVGKTGRSVYYERI